MKKILHITSLILYTAIILGVTVFLTIFGSEYYGMPLEERFYNPLHEAYKPSGIIGHGLGIIGTLLIFIGVTFYIATKRYNFLAKYIRLKYLLEFHIFLCTLGPVLILFHTAFKFGGIISIAFWSMVAVVLSGVVGRFIYIQIPHSIEGRELSLNELQQMKTDLSTVLHEKYKLDSNVAETIAGFTSGQNIQRKRKTIRKLKKLLKSNSLPKRVRKSIVVMVKKEMSLASKIARLQSMQKLFKYWHVAHLPFALIMLIIVVIHVIITLVFGYKWIF